MSNFFKTLNILLIVFSVYVLLDTFVLKSEGVKVSKNQTATKNNVDESYTDTTYTSDDIKITIKTYRENDTNIYVADIETDDINYLKRAFANDTFGKNYTEKTSTLASNNKAILAINGDFYGFRNNGFVAMNGEIYRTTSNGNEALIITNDGEFEIVDEDSTDLSSLKNVYQALSFGPGLVNSGKITVSENDEVGQAMASNPRTAIGKTSDGHYVFVVSDGRTSESSGLSLYELAQFMKSIDCTVAYNLDGGGSSTMYFNGKIVNNPTGGRGSSERSVSDIVYIGY